MAELIKDRYEFNAGVKFSQGQQLWCKIPATPLYSLPNSAHGDVFGEIICRRLNGIAELGESKPNLRPVVSDSAALPPQVFRTLTMATIHNQGEKHEAFRNNNGQCNRDTG